MFNVGIAWLLELCERGEAVGWRRAQLGVPRCSTPGPAPGPPAGAGTGRALRSSPRRRPAPKALIIYGSAVACGEIAGQLGGEGTGTFPRCVSPSGRPCPARRASAAVPGARYRRRARGSPAAPPCGSGLWSPGRAGAPPPLASGTKVLVTAGSFAPRARRGEQPVPRGSAGSPSPVRAGAPHRGHFPCAGGGCSRIPAGQSEP